MIRVLFFPVLLLIALSCSKPESVNRKMMLNEGWEFRQAGTSPWHAAQVPGTIHTDLMRNKMTEDPYFRDNENKVQWIGTKDWEYCRIFSLSSKDLDIQEVRLVFEGLDTYADVYLNGKRVLQAANMFRTWKTECRKFLKEGENELRVLFHSSAIRDSLQAAKLGYILPDNRAFTRKAAYQNGWDWGPELLTCGIWRPVYLEFTGDIDFENVFVQTRGISNEKASLGAKLNIRMKEDGKVKIRIFNEDKEIRDSTLNLITGDNSALIPFVISDPELWWPNGQGSQKLYKLRFSVEGKGMREEKTLDFGIRTIRLIQEKTSEGSGFAFEINGRKVFMKGANYIPQDNFVTRVPPEKHESLLKSVAASNMNMLRVWGGGIYEEDIFYELCDRYGILVWQDFMFACNLYPGDPQFLDNVRMEAVDNVIRLRNHACIALWCGNNEINEGWHNWGWQKQLDYSASDSTKVWHDYLALFEKTLPEVVKEYDPGRVYWPSSPLYGWGRPQSLTHGDSHYWGVWWGNEPFEIYEQKVGRFMSEYGFQGFPDRATVNAFTFPDDRNLSSHVIKVHQKHPVGMETIDLYLKREYPLTENFEEYNYLSQLCQAYGIKRAVEAHRRAMPWCMGTLYWQLNDCWPVISWSGLDYYQRPKALHYFITKAFENLLLSFRPSGDTLQIMGISDLTEKLSCNLEYRLMDFSGKVLNSSVTTVSVEPGTSRVLAGIPPGFLPGKPILNKALIVAELKDKAGKILTTALYYFVPPKDLELPACDIRKGISSSGKEVVIRLESAVVAKNVYLSFEGLEGIFSDNYFDLLPGATREIVFTPAGGTKPVVQQLRLLTLNDLVNKD